MPVRWTRMLGAPWVAAPGSWNGEAHPGSGPLARGCLCRVSTLAGGLPGGVTGVIEPGRPAFGRQMAARWATSHGMPRSSARCSAR